MDLHDPRTCPTCQRLRWRVVVGDIECGGAGNPCDLCGNDHGVVKPIDTRARVDDTEGGRASGSQAGEVNNMTFDTNDGPVGSDDGYSAPSFWEAEHDADEEARHSTLLCPICEDGYQRAEEAKVF